MASPQKENGHTAIANEILDTLCKTRINGQDRQVLDFIFRKTYGWQKKRDRISLSQFEDGTGMKRARICDCIKNLINMKIIIKIQDDNGSTYEFNKNYDEWEVVPKQARASLGHDVVAPTPRGTHNNGVVPQVGRPIDEYRVVPQVGIGVVPQVGHTKENNTKETIQKKESKNKNFSPTLKPNTEKGWRDVRRVEAGKEPSKTPRSEKQIETFEALKWKDYFREQGHSQHGMQFFKVKNEKREKIVSKLVIAAAKEVEMKELIDWWFEGAGEWAEYEPEQCFSSKTLERFLNKGKVIPKNKQSNVGKGVW